MAASGVLSSWLMLATNCDLCWLAISSSRLFLGDLLEQAGVPQRDGRLVGEGLEQPHDLRREHARLVAPDGERADQITLVQQRNCEHRAHAGLNQRVAQSRCGQSRRGQSVQILDLHRLASDPAFADKGSLRRNGRARMLAMASALMSWAASSLNSPSPRQTHRWLHRSQRPWCSPARSRSAGPETDRATSRPSGPPRRGHGAPRLSGSAHAFAPAPLRTVARFRWR